jgi:enamine deaminase RidA (YjgF/YER057c/UK114 family)
MSIADTNRIFPEIDFFMPGEIVSSSGCGVVSEDKWGCYALLKGIFPEDNSASPFCQAKSAFVAMDMELSKVFMSFSDVVRTWIYADDILDWYSEFNQARNEFFSSHGVYENLVPASTGIGWSNSRGSKIVLGAFAVKAKFPGSLEVEVLPSPLQCPALEYGSSFSRAVEIRTPEWTRVIVSGTASIKPCSHDVAHIGDIDAQIDCTMNAVEAIYRSRGMSFHDVSGALVYLKAECYRENWTRWLEQHREFPLEHSKAIVADVCRDEWLFEIESDAFVPTAHNSGTLSAPKI